MSAPTRLQAAEREVIEAALAVPFRENYATPRLGDACDRLRSLRERFAEAGDVACGRTTALEIAPRIGNTVDLTISVTATLTCTLPLGHIGDCEVLVGDQLIRWHMNGSGEFGR